MVMGTASHAAQSVDVTDEQRGIRIQQRRLALGLNSVHKFARAAKMTRSAITNAEKGKAASATYLVLEALLDRLEAGEPLPNDEPEATEPGVFLFEIEGEGVRVVAHVPDTGNPEELRAAVAAIIQGIKNNAAPTTTDEGP
jgi:transcriptional regulator with XRE-family HTH domain